MIVFILQHPFGASMRIAYLSITSELDTVVVRRMTVPRSFVLAPWDFTSLLCSGVSYGPCWSLNS